MSQATVFDGISGQFDIEYNYRRGQKQYTNGKLRLFSSPFGRAASARPYASASAVGPLLMISPYASGGAAALVASTTGYGASGGIYSPNGPSGGISYIGSPSLAGDAPALLQISYVGPMATGASRNGDVPYAAISLLPDQYYAPLITSPRDRVRQLLRTHNTQARSNGHRKQLPIAWGQPITCRSHWSMISFSSDGAGFSSAQEPTNIGLVRNDCSS